MLDLNGMDAFINEEVPSQEEEDVWQKPYQGFPDSPDMVNVVDQENYEKTVDTYDQFIGAEVCLPDEWGRKMMARVTKRVKYNEVNPRGIEHSKLFADHSLYEVSFTKERTEELTANVINENKLPWLFCLFCGSVFLSCCLGSILCLRVPESLISKVRSGCTLLCASVREFLCICMRAAFCWCAWVHRVICRSC